MRCILAVAFAVVLVVAEGKVLPASDVENQQTTNQTPQISDFLREAQTAISNLGTQIQDKLNVPDQDALAATIREQSNNFVANMQNFFHNMTEEVKNSNPELVNTWTNFKNKITETVNKMAVTPETTEQLNQLRAKFDEGVQSVLTESEKIANNISTHSEKIQQDITKFAKDAVDIAVHASQNLNNQLQHTATQTES